jgi:hypothetical protein
MFLKFNKLVIFKHWYLSDSISVSLVQPREAAENCRNWSFDAEWRGRMLHNCSLVLEPENRADKHIHQHGQICTNIPSRRQRNNSSIKNRFVNF